VALVQDRLIIVPGAGHDDALDSGTWQQVDDWIDAALGSPP
jgi:hypothetical protein